MPNQRHIHELQPNKDKIAILGGVSMKDGSYHQLLQDKYYKKEDVVTFLQELRDRFPNEELVVFTDNASIHRARLVKYFCEDNKIEVLFNKPYQPQWAGIEFYW